MVISLSSTRPYFNETVSSTSVNKYVPTGIAPDLPIPSDPIVIVSSYSSPIKFLPLTINWIPSAALGSSSPSRVLLICKYPTPL